MKIICTKSDLLSGVNIVLKAIPSRTTMTILECILIDASANEIKLTANDMELGIETVVKGEIEQRGKIAIDAKIFSDIIRKLPDSEVTIETDENFVAKISCEKAIFNISGKAGDDFSYLPYIEKDKYIELSKFSLKEVIRQTIFSIADSESSNRIMTGELFEITENNLRVVSLDGHRISIRNITLKDSYDPLKVIVPGKTLNEISKILSGEADEMVNIFFTNNHILFEFDDTKVVSRLIDGEFFKIDQMLSKDYETKIIINKKEFLDCIDRSMLLVKEGDKKPIIVNITDGSLEIKINSTLGSMNEDIDITKEGKDIMIGFNGRFLMDALRVIDDEQISIYLMNSKAPCFIRDDKNEYIYLILPVNFNNY
ncbi:MAG: DNA polymerase III subunit beta [Lachnospiraceae bacterium]